MNKNSIANFNYKNIRQNGASLFPTRCVFYLTLRCNLHCEMCFQKKHRVMDELSLDEIRNTFQKIPISHLHLVGGEIFVRKDIKEILMYFDSIIENISIQTNATYLDEALCDFLIKLKNVKEISISIDGLENIHDSIRGKGVFGQAIFAIRKLRTYKHVSVTTVVMKKNVAQLVQLCEFLRKEHIHSWCIQLEMIYSERQRENTQKLLTQKGIYDNIHKDCVLEEIDLSYISILKNQLDYLFGTSNHMQIDLKPDIYANDVDSYIQGHPKGSVCCYDIKNSVIKIYPNGDIMLCEALNIKIGNCLKDEVLEIWNCTESKLKRKAICNPTVIDMCSRCCNLSVEKGCESN